MQQFGKCNSKIYLCRRNLYSMLATFLVFLSLILIVLFFHWSKIKKWLEFQKMIKNLPASTMPALPFIGHSYLIVGASSAYFHFVAEMANVMFQLTRYKIVSFWLGPVPLVIVSHPDSAEVILKRLKTY